MLVIKPNVQVLPSLQSELLSSHQKIGQTNQFMKINKNGFFIGMLLAIFTSVEMHAQGLLSTYIDAGENNISEGLYIKTALFGQYHFVKTRIEGGIQLDVKSANSNFLTGISLKASQEFVIKEFPFEVQGLFMYTPFSDVIHESNWGMLINIERSHFNFQLGTNFRTYRITQKAAENYDINSSRSLHENWNLMYLVGYDLKPEDHTWNIGVSITNIDHFLINQETNPMLKFRGKYAISTPLTIYAESWYKSAGSLNISANYFGFFFRTGLIWKLDSKK